MKRLKYEEEYEKFCRWFDKHPDSQSYFGEYLDFSDHETTMGAYFPYDYSQFVYRLKRYGKFWVN